MNTAPVIASVSVQAPVDREAVSKLVDRGAELHRLLAAHTQELEHIKAALREAAATGAFPERKPPTVEIPSLFSENVAHVSKCKDTPVLLEGADTGVLMLLTQSQFDLMFKRAIVMQKAEAFEKAFKLQPKKVQNIVKRVVAWRPNSAQVRFDR